MELKEYRFGEVTINFDKKRVPLSGAQREKRQGNFRYYGAQGVIDHIDDFIFDGTYLLIAEDGENLKSKKQNIAQVVDGQFWVNNHAHIVQGNELCNTRYLCYLLNSMDLSGYITGSAQPKLSQANLNTVTLFLPDIAVQERIVEWLYLFDKKIEVNKQINDNLEKLSKLFFYNWFISYEKFGGQRPINWSVGTLKDIADFFNGYAFKSSELLKMPQSNSYCVFKQGHIKIGGGFNCDGTKSWIKKNKIQNLNRFILQKGDILMAMTDMKDNVQILGNTAIMSVDDQYIVNQRVGVLRAKKDLGINYPYLYMLTNSKNFLTDLRSRANSGVQVNLSSSEIKNSMVYIAPKKIYEEFNNIVLPLYEQIIHNNIENQNLNDIRNSILPKILNGQIKLLNTSI